MKHKTILAICLAFLVVYLNGCDKNGPPPTNPPGTVVWDVQWIAAEKCPLTLHLEKQLDGGGGKPCYPEGSCGSTIDYDGGYYYAWVECQGTRYYYDPCIDTIRSPNARPRNKFVAVIPTDTLHLRMIIKPGR
jgi:hypothetical protein